MNNACQSAVVCPNDGLFRKQLHIYRLAAEEQERRDYELAVRLAQVRCCFSYIVLYVYDNSDWCTNQNINF